MRILFFVFCFILGGCAYLSPKIEEKKVFDALAPVLNEAEVAEPRKTELLTPDEISTQSSSRVGNYIVSRDARNEVIGFSILNSGANAIVPIKAKIGEGPERQWSFEFQGRRAQDIELRLTDTPTARLSDLRESWMMFFPRKVVPAIEVLADGRYQVTLPTAEEFFFKGDTHEVESGVIQERPMDLQAYERSRDLFPDVQYSGKGVWLRVRRRGESPHHGQIAIIVKNNEQGQYQATCQLHSSLLWQQTEGTGNHFLFSQDVDFDFFLKARCGWGFL